MIESVKLESFQRGSITLSMDGRTGDSRFRILDIAGLGPVRAAISTSKAAFSDGGQHQNSRVDERNIVVQLGFNPNYSQGGDVQALRTYLNRLLLPKESVTLTFTSSGHPTVKIVGWVETLEPTIFAREPSISISIICPNPYFQDLEPTIVTANPNDSNWARIDYQGSASAGYRAAFDVTRDASIQILHYNAFNLGPFYNGMSINFPFKNGDKVAISTVPGDKYIRYFRSGLTTYITGYLASGSKWLQFVPLVEEAHYDYVAAQYLDTAQNIPGATFTYTSQYGGI